jgi:kumamolisin
LQVSITRRQLALRRKQEYAPAAEAFRRFAKEAAITVQRVDLTRRLIVLSGTIDRISEAFGIRLRVYDDGTHRFLSRSGPVRLPHAVARWTRAVLGLDQRPHLRHPVHLSGNGGGSGLWPTEVAALYGIPIDRNVAGQCVGIIALGGGYQTSDAMAALQRMNRPALPQIVDVSIGGASNQYGGGTEADEEIALDLQVVAGIVPSAKIVVYFAGNRVENLVQAVQYAVLDSANRPKILTISWGSSEGFWHKDVVDTMQAALGDAISTRVTVIAAAGDMLATAGVPDGAAHVSFPASSPYVLACGGTAITVENGAISQEKVWNDGTVGTGGGISEVFGLVPAYQAGLSIPVSVSTGHAGRGVPDVAAAASGDPGYRIVLGGREVTKDGTSAVAPLWAAMLAMANAERPSPIGFANPLLYANQANLRPITLGNNKVKNLGYVAASGSLWNGCTGLGVPKGAQLIASLASIATS